MILAIESSCDESAIALFNPKTGLIGEWVHSQLKLHSEYGGVVPSLASREHLVNFPFLLEATINKLQELDLSTSSLTQVAVTYGPGLAGCLALGISLAKAIGLAFKIPVIGVNHLRAHAFSPFINLFEQDPNNYFNNFNKLLPHLGLLVSGGNTLLFEISKNNTITILAQTIDDAAGEALDKGAKLLGMPYPGGALIETKAKLGNPSAYDFPRSMGKTLDDRFSFSGLKTSLRYLLEKMSDDELTTSLNDLCASYQSAVIDQLYFKTKHFLKTKPYASLGLSGGVSNNKVLRNAFEELANHHKIPAYIAQPKHTGDNAGMIAFAAYADSLACKPNTLGKLSFIPNLTLTD